MPQHSAQVIDLDSEIRPKTLNKSYRGCPLVITYLVQEKKWQWTATITHVTRFTDTAPTMNQAMRAAEKHIDRAKELQR